MQFLRLDHAASESKPETHRQDTRNGRPRARPTVETRSKRCHAAPSCLENEPSVNANHVPDAPGVFARVGGSGAGFQPAAAGHLARVPNTGWKPKLAGKMPAPLMLTDISRTRPPGPPGTAPQNGLDVKAKVDRLFAKPL